MPSRRDEWYREGHPPACTCVACNNRRLGISSFGRSGRSARRTPVATGLLLLLIGFVATASIGCALLAQSPNSSPFRTVSPSPTLIPSTVVVSASPPERTPIPTVGVVILTSTSIPAQVASGSTGIFESLKDLVATNAAIQPEIDLKLFAERIHDLINIERMRHGMVALAFDSKIAAIAQNHSSDMARNDYFEYENLRGLSPTERGSAVDYDCMKTYDGYYTFGLAENIYQAWLYSSTTYINGIAIRERHSQEELAMLIVQGWMDSLVTWRIS